MKRLDRQQGRSGSFCWMVDRRMLLWVPMNCWQMWLIQMSFLCFPHFPRQSSLTLGLWRNDQTVRSDWMIGNRPSKAQTEQRIRVIFTWVGGWMLRNRRVNESVSAEACEWLFSNPSVFDGGVRPHISLLTSGVWVFLLMPALLQLYGENLCLFVTGDLFLTWSSAQLLDYCLIKTL